MRYTPKYELDNRIERLQVQLQKQNVDGALIVQNADMFYFTGTIQQAYLFVPAEGKPIVFVMKSFIRAKQESPLEHIVAIEKLRDIPILLSDFGYTSFKSIGLELDVLPANLYARCGKMFAPAKVEDVSTLIRGVRIVKSPYELNIIREAGQMSQDVFEYVKNHIKDGMTEFELVAMIESFSRLKGHVGYIRPRGFNQEFGYVHLLSGPDASVAGFGSGPLGGRGSSVAYPIGPSNRRILPNEPIVLDYESWVEGYMTDMTRTYCIGKLPDNMVVAYDLAVQIQETLKDIAKPGTQCGELFNKAQDLVRQQKLENHFMGLEKPVQFVAHGVGIEVDELPVIAPKNPMLLEKNMVIAIEPKFVFENGAVGIENTFVVGDNGLEVLTVFDENIQYV